MTTTTTNTQPTADQTRPEGVDAKHAGEKPRAQTPAERKAAREAARTEHRLAGGLARNAAGNPDARGLLCLCGCEKPTHRDEALFLSGHDARMRADLLARAAERQVLDALPFFARAFVREAGPVAGLALDPTDETGQRLLDVKKGA